MPFDRAIIHRPQTNNPAVIDDLHFGIPTPGAIAVLAVAGLFGTGSRRRCRAPTLDTGDPYRPGDN